MKMLYKMVAIISSFFIISHASATDPWFTGPIFAPGGRTIPRGHTNFEIYGIGLNSGGQYNQSGVFVPTPRFRSRVANPILGHGFTDWLDAQIIVPYAYNSTLGANYQHLTDVSAVIGLQVLEQKDSRIKPNLRVTVQQVFPTGRFERLNPQFFGTDATGYGSYQTIVAFNFQHLAEVFQSHYLRTRLSLSHLYAGPVTIHGLSSYGGSEDTFGRIRPGSENDIDLAFEYTVTQNWVAVMEGYISKGDATRFNGLLATGNFATPGSANYYEEALAPAIEYNFNANVGIIGGVWFPIKGRSTADYTTYVLALNAFW